ncbi:MAG: FAD:protein FMN transferase [Paracoccus sp. (in: a-proteobacteria)]|nr:FAD:protein FMN transferase [Paracoccus sp. (in: a-proteobacteria)]
MSTSQHEVSRRFLIAAGIGLLAAPALGRGAAPVSVIGGEAFGAGWQVTVGRGAELDRLTARIASVLDEVDRQMSPWRPDSEVTRLNRAGAGAFRAGDELAALAAQALQLAGASGGRFDPTVGPLVARFGFGPIKGDGAPHLAGLRVEQGAIIKDRAALTFDPCGIAKGHALDRVAALLRAEGQGDFLIDLGGDLRAEGARPDGASWRIGIEDPRPGADALAAVIVPAGLAVATSGVRAQGYDLGGRRYSHIIDPALGAPVESRLLSATVAHADGPLADGWATALMAAGDGAEALARSAGLDALLLESDAEGGLARQATGRMAHLLDA